MGRMNDIIVSRLQEVGFSLYEARLYLALLRGGAQNGNEVAKSANVPSSKVCTALEKLANKGIVQSLNSGNLVRFTALPPSELVPRLRSRFNAPLDVLADELPKVAAAEPPEPFLTVSGESALFRAACAIIGAAQNEIHLSCWQQDIAALWDAIATVDGRGVRVFGMLYGEGELPAGTWLRREAPGARLEEVESTAEAARRAGEEPGVAAVGSVLAAEAHGLTILARNIQDARANATRFIVLGRAWAGRTGKDKTSLVFVFKDRPGGLRDALSAFSDEGINLTRIESRPSRRQAWTYVFFVDFQGHPEDERVKHALEKLGERCTYVGLIGAYPEVPNEVTG
jgi:sugar-specific transcriptional regulator TrmB